MRLHNANAVAAIAFRDFTKYLRDRTRVATSFIFPIIFVGILGTSLQANVGENLGYDFVTFTLTGVLAQILFQSTAYAMLRIQDERGEDLTQELFVAPISRYTIIIGKIIGGSLIASVESIGVILFGLLIGVRFNLTELLSIVIALPILCLLGGAFGIFITSLVGSKAASNQIFPLLFFPQFFLAGVFSPIKTLPTILLIPSRLVPMTYAVDLLRSLFYAGKTEATDVVIFSPAVNLIVIALYFTVFLVIGTLLFIRREQEK
jgi:ABC-2 type transport system permease protein